MMALENQEVVLLASSLREYVLGQCDYAKSNAAAKVLMGLDAVCESDAARSSCRALREHLLRGTASLSLSSPSPSSQRIAAIAEEAAASLSPDAATTRAAAAQRGQQPPSFLGTLRMDFSKIAPLDPAFKWALDPSLDPRAAAAAAASAAPPPQNPPRQPSSSSGLGPGSQGPRSGGPLSSISGNVAAAAQQHPHPQQPRCPSLQPGHDPEGPAVTAYSKPKGFSAPPTTVSPPSAAPQPAPAPAPAPQAPVIIGVKRPSPEDEGAAQAQDRWAGGGQGGRRGVPPMLGRPGGGAEGFGREDDEDCVAVAIDRAVAAGAASFTTAKAKLVEDLQKNAGGGGPGPGGAAARELPQVSGQHVSGLRRPMGPRKTGAAPGAPAGNPGSTVRGGFIPPFVRKALDTGPDGAPGNGGKGGPPGARGAGAAGAAGAAAPEGPLSARTLELLGVGPDGGLPEPLCRMDAALVETVCNEVLDRGGSVTFEDIAGQGDAKRIVQEMIVWPMKNPHLFTGARAPPRGLLLFGPPGTGKTLIGKAIASTTGATFFSISASSLCSKWIGEGERLVRALFAVAAHLQPSVIFIDEIDSLLSARKADGEHESSRRLKTEILVQMEGCDPSSAERRVLLIGATNRPEELDEAARRRMPKQLYIPLPCGEARTQMILRGLKDIRSALSDTDISKVVQRTEGYSGSDMRNLIQEACQGPVREAVLTHGEAVGSLKEEDLRPVGLRDFQVAARAQKASVHPSEVARYVSYNDKHGARYVEQDVVEDEW